MRYLTEVPTSIQIDEMCEFVDELYDNFSFWHFSSCEDMTEEEKKSLLMKFDSFVTDFLYEKRNMRCYDE